LHPGLVAFYRFDRTSGSVLIDLTGNGNHAAFTSTPGPTWSDSNAFNIWTGIVDSNWNDAGNWTDGIPGIGSNVHIPAGTANPAVITAPAALNHLVVESGAVITITGELSATGHVYNYGTINGTGDLNLSGSAMKTILPGTIANLDVANAAGVILSGPLVVNDKLTMTLGAIIPNGYTVSFAGDASLVYNGSGLLTSDVEFPAVNGPASLVIAGNATLHADRILNGNVTINPGAALDGAGFDISLAGNWTNNGIFIPGAGTVFLTGAAQAVIGSTTFNNLVKNNSSPTTLTFDNAGIQTILTALDLQGAAGAHLAIRSNLPGNQWQIEPQGTRTIAWLDVQDSNNLDPEHIMAEGTDSVNSGNNSNWNFGSPFLAVPIPDVGADEDDPDYPIDLIPLFDDPDDGSAGLVHTVEANTDPTLFTSTNIAGGTLALDFAPDRNGASDITIRATDTGGLFVEDTFTVSLAPVADPPVIAQGDSRSVNMSEDAWPTNFFLILNASDADGDPPIWSILTQAVNGAASITPGTPFSRLINYTPNPDFFGTDSFEIIVEDGTGLSDTILINVNVIPQDDPPTIVEGSSVTVNMSQNGTPAPFDLTLNATDADGDTLTWSIQSPASNGSAGASGTGEFMAITYTPITDYVGSDSFVVRVTDTTAGWDAITVNVNVIAGLNNPPEIIEGNAVTVDMSRNGSPTPFNLTLNAIDPEGDPLTWSISTPASNGTAVASGTGYSKAISYTPNPDYLGTDTFAVKVSDGIFEDTILVTVNIGTPNTPPVITAGDTINVDMSRDGSPTPFSLTLNASDADEDTLTWLVSSAAANGTASASGMGYSKSISYTPNTGYIGTDTFVVMVDDGVGGTDTIAVYVNITSGNNAPVLDNSRTYSLAGIIEDAATADIQGTRLSDMLAGSGADAITDLDDGALEGIAVTYADIAYGTWEHDHDNDGVFTAFPAGVSESSALLLNDEVMIRFLPNADYFGTLSPGIIFRAWDRTAGANGDKGVNTVSNGGATAFSSRTAMAEIEVTGLNDAPDFTAEDPSPVLGDGGEKTFRDWAVFDPGNSDESDQTATYMVDNVSNPGFFTLVPEVSADGVLSFTPAAGTEGTSMFDVTVQDSGGVENGGEDTSETKTFTITITASSTAPTCEDGEQNGNETGVDCGGDCEPCPPPGNAPVIEQGETIRVEMDEDGDPTPFNLTLNASSVSGAELTWSLYTTPAKGIASADGVGSTMDVSYAPGEDENGEDTFTIQVTDGDLNDSIEVNVTIHPKNDPPVITEGEALVLELDTGVAASVSTKLSASDVDGDDLTWEISTPPANGEAAVGKMGESLDVSYTPKPGYIGADSFTIQVSDDELSDTIEFSVTIIGEVLSGTADFSSDLTAGTLPLALQFTNLSTGAIEWTWNFGDGAGSSEEHPAHIYTAPGSYTVSLTIKGTWGEDTKTVSDFIQVENATVDVAFTVDQREGRIPLEVTFTPKSEDDITSFEWDFGDGTSGSGPKPTHTYQTEGLFTVKLTATGNAGSKTIEKTEYIQAIGVRRISGRVMDHSGAAVDNAIVSAWLGGTIKATSVARGGAFVLENLEPSDDYVIEVKPTAGDKQLALTFHEGKESRDEANHVSIIDGDLENFDLTLLPTSRQGFTGKVHNGSGAGIAGVEVSAFSNSAVSGANAVTNVSGIYTITGVKEATDYIISATTSLDNEFYYAIPPGKTPGAHTPTFSAFFWDEGTPITPADPPLENIDIIANADQGAFISGHVFDTNNNPLADILVNARSESGKTGSERTDAEGAYKITGLVEVSPDDAAAQGYLVEVWTNGYPYQAYKDAGDPDSATRVETGRTDVDFHLETGASISGTVRDADGNPVPGLDVLAWSSAGAGEGAAQTDNAGTFSISDLPATNDYIVSVFPMDAPVQYYNGKTMADDADLLNLATGNVQGIDFTLKKGAEVSGQLTLSDGSPAPAGITVYVWSEATGTGGEVTTNENGEFQMAGLPGNPSDYVITIAAPDFQSTGTGDTGGNGGSSSGFNLTLAPGYRLTGLVAFDEIPVEGARVEACSAEGTCGYAVTRAAAVGGANYEITGLAPGDYSITVYPENYPSQTMSAVRIDADTSSINFTLVKAKEYTLSGTIYNLAAGKTLFLHAMSREKEFSRVIELTGTGQELTYDLEGMAAAPDYRVEISSNDYAYQVYKEQNEWENATMVKLFEGDALGIDFILSPNTAIISGNVTFPLSAKSEDTVRIYAVSESVGSQGSAEVVMNGERLVPYRITGLVNAPDYIVSTVSDKFIKQYYNATGDAIDATPVDTNSGAGINFILQSGASISGIITGNDPTGVRVEAWSDILESGGGTEVGPDGAWTISGLAPTEDYHISAGKQGFPTIYYGGNQTVYSVDQAKLVDTTDGDRTDIEMTFSEGDPITGSVEDQNGLPVQRVWVEAFSESKKSGNGVFTGKDGSFMVAGLPQGRDYSVSAIPDFDMGLMRQKRNPVASGSDGVNFRLAPRMGFRLWGSINDATGDPIPKTEVELRSKSLGISTWLAVSHSALEDLHLENRFEFIALPPADDYVVYAKPPSDSPYAALSLQDLSINTDRSVNIVLSLGAEISGTIYKTVNGENVPIRGVKVTAISISNDFVGEAFTGRNGTYTITNAPDASDYIITPSADGFMEPSLSGQYPGSGIDFVLARSGTLSGVVKDKTTNQAVEGAVVEAHSLYLQGVDTFSGSAITDNKGRYTINQLQKEYMDEALGIAVEVDDYVLTVSADSYPPRSIGGRPLDTAMHFLLSSGPENVISGTAVTEDGAFPETMDIFNLDGEFIKTIPVDEKGVFKAGGLSEGRAFYLMFTLYEGDDEIQQWAGEGDTGVGNIDGDGPPVNAKSYYPGTSVDIILIPLVDSVRSAKRAPRAVRGLRSTSHIDMKGRSLARSVPSDDISVRNLYSTAARIVSNDPYITVSWEPTMDSVQERYYYVFNQTTGHVITKRNAPSMRPVTNRKVVSRALTGDDVVYNCHVAAVDSRGRIGVTDSIDFRIDTVPPGNVQVYKEDTISPSIIQLIMGASGAYDMNISNIGHGISAKWEKYVKIRDWRRKKGGDGIYVQFRDEAKNTVNARAIVEPPVIQYSINAVAGEHGRIEPTGVVFVNQGASQTFTIIPDPGSSLKTVTVNGHPVDLDINGTYTFADVNGDSSITATFVQVFYTIYAQCGSGGTLDRSGELIVSRDSDQVFVITPDPGYRIERVMLDGQPVLHNEDNTFRIINVSKDYNLSVTFIPVSPKTHEVKATAGLHGRISPSGTVTVSDGEDITFTITPSTGFGLDTVYLDGNPVSIIDNFLKLRNVTEAHEVNVTFKSL
jgi:PKD repeat protein